MGHTIQFESHKNELAFITQMEYDSEIIEYWDQPSPIKISYKNKAGKQHARFYTPDFLVIKNNSAGWVECKTQKELEELSFSSGLYFFDGEKWRFPPGEEVAERNGLFFQVYSSSQTNWTYLRNLKFLEDYFTDDLAIQEEAKNRIMSIVSAKPGILLSELLLLCQKFNFPADFIYFLIATRTLHVDLVNNLLSQISSITVFASSFDLRSDHSANLFQSMIDSSVVWEAGDQLIWDGKKYEVVNHGETETWLKEDSGKILSLENKSFISLYQEDHIHIINPSDEYENTENGSIAEILFAASPAALFEANRRSNILKHYAQTKQLLAGSSLRTIRRWQNEFKRAEIIYGNGFVGLIDKKKNRGNRSAKLPAETANISNEFIEEVYENPKQSSVYSVWTKLKTECEKRGVTPPSHNTFYLSVKARPKHEQELKRRGRVAAYKYEEFYFELSDSTPRHGERPFEIVHIDHTELEIELICSQTGKNLGRPWLTLAIDAYSRRCVGFFLSFDKPSYRSCMMVMRDMIQRYNRFPQTIVVDGGLDFNSAYFEALVAFYNCTLKVRPGKKPRFGTLIERLFLTTNLQFVYNLTGNSQLAAENIRYLVKEVNPKNLAIWTIEFLYQRLGEYFFQVYDQLEHSTLGVSPRQMFLNGITKFGERKHKHIIYDESFRLMSLPTTKTGKSKVYPNAGVIINYIRYWTPHFRNSNIENKKIPVRFDPYDIGIAYAYLNGRWERCLSEYFDVFNNRTEKEILMATAEIRKRRKGQGRFNFNAKLLAQFLLSIDTTEDTLIALQRQKDFEMKRILNQADPSSIYQLSSAEQNTIKLFSGNSDQIITENEVPEELMYIDDLPIDTSKLRIFGDY